jgi:anaerobic selenocysteine-containing dehydrogenase
LSSVSPNGSNTVTSTCKMCLHSCGITVKVEEGVITKIEGDPSNPANYGKLCPKGNSGILRQYDPYRVTKPLKRTNPKKGPGEDPGWVEISWEEALETTAAKFKAAIEKNPGKLQPAINDFQRLYNWAWGASFGCGNFFSTVGTYCGGGYHPVNGIYHSTFAAINDYLHCNYWIQVGGGDGFSSHLHVTGSIKRMADARMRGMKVVIVEPRLSVGAAKADEWLSIRPATDRFFVLGLIHVLLHELDRFDKEFVTHHTSGPYLVGTDGLFVRDDEGRALVWDSDRGKAVPWNDPELKTPVLEGTFTVNGQSATTGFSLMKETYRELTPEKVAEITTIPAETIRRIATEFVDAARIGSTIMIEGKSYRYRPAAINYYRGGQAHSYSVQDNMAYKVLNLLVGALDAVGGHLGVLLDTRTSWEEGPDGLLDPKPHQLGPGVPFSWPPKTTHLRDFFPIGVDPGQLNHMTLHDPEKWGVQDMLPEAMLIYHANPLWNMPGNSKKWFDIMNSVDFIAAIDVVLNESSVWADIVMPDKTYLESWNLLMIEPPSTYGMQLRQPAVEARGESRDATEILYDISERMGMLANWNDVLNFVLGFVNAPEFMLSSDKKHTPEELVDNLAKMVYGPDFGIDWFKENGHKVVERMPEISYEPHPYKHPLYNEYLVKVGIELKAEFEKNQVPIEWDFSQYVPFPDGRLGPVHTEAPEYDLYAITFKDTQVNFSENLSIPWIADIVSRDPIHMGILMNPRTAEAKGLNDGDLIEIRSREDAIKGSVKIVEGVHPETLAVSNAVGKWMEDHPIVKPGGGHFNRLLPADLDYTCLVTGGLESVAKVKVTKLAAAEA